MFNLLVIITLYLFNLEQKMYNHCLVFVLLCYGLLYYQDASCQKYFGQCGDSVCGNLTCVQHHHNVSTYSCLRACHTNDTAETDCASLFNCSTRVCAGGFLCMSYVNYSVCQCQVGLSGDQCEVNVTVECPDRCSNYTDVCTNRTNGDIVCHCDRHRAGKNCSVYLCSNQTTCGDYGSCRPDPDSIEGYKCLCQDGFTGSLCNKPINECASNPCKNGAICHDVIGSFWCNCTGNWTGPVCDVSGDDTVCRINNCSTKSINGICDKECDDIVCNFDNTDCLFGVDNPWKSCLAGDRHCMNKFNDGTCDAKCNNEKCLYDGFDCLPPVNCENEQCYMTINDGHCDVNCSSKDCFYDGYDCYLSSSQTYIGSIIFHFSSNLNLSESNNILNLLAQQIGLGTRVGLFLKKPYNMSHVREVGMQKIVYDIELLFSCGDNSKHCWTSIQSYRIFLAAFLKRNYNLALPENITTITACPLSMYGEHCNMTCNRNCIAFCDTVTGICNGGCVSGYHGEMCDETPNSQEEEKRRLNIIVSIVIVILILVAVVILVIILCFCKQRKLRAKKEPGTQLNNKRHSSVSRQGTIPLSTASRGLELDNAKLVIDLDSDHDVINLDDDKHQLISTTGSTERLIADDNNKGEEVETDLGANVTDKELKVEETDENLKKRAIGEELGAEVTDKDLESKVTDENLEEKVTDEDLESKVTDENLGEKVTDEDLESKVTDENLGENVTDEDLEANVTDKDLGAKVTEENLKTVVNHEDLGANITFEDLGAKVTGEDLGAKVTNEDLEAKVTDDEDLGAKVTNRDLGAKVTGDDLGAKLTEENLNTVFTDKDLGAKATSEDLKAKVNDEDLGSKVTDKDLGENVTDEDLGSKVTDEDLGSKVTDKDLGSKVNDEDLAVKVNNENLGVKINEDNIQNEVAADSKDIEFSKDNQISTGHTDENMAEITEDKKAI
ncbi:hypothetical protein KUTeg_015824 [Tegillarca granosa]|uniref:Uncharacterized protein n=1 Tax=Tegillarca granosa TaxID=220873 RepID=A0ABQ9EKC5_TEGGR|nr:hypothetical protein KUTeg_015824 [Tegillarca granosa]